MIIEIENYKYAIQNEKKSFNLWKLHTLDLVFLKLTPFLILLHNDVSNFWGNAIFLRTIYYEKLYVQIIAKSSPVYNVLRFKSLFPNGYLNKWARPSSQKMHKKTLFLCPNSSLGNLSSFAYFLSESRFSALIPHSNTLKMWKNWFKKNVTTQNLQFHAALAQREPHHHLPHKILTNSGQKIILIRSTIAVLS